jgi:hypothetical protein
MRYSRRDLMWDLVFRSLSDARDGKSSSTEMYGNLLLAMTEKQVATPQVRITMSCNRLLR